jgi:hypothetical protein
LALVDHILRRVRGHGRGFVFSPGDLLDLGGRAAVDQALGRLTRDGQIRRIDRGLYDLPRLHARVGKLWPSADAVAKALARRTDSHIKASGPLAANLLGLSTQVPAKVVYLTDGPSRTVRVGRLQVSLKHAGRVDMLLPGSNAGLAIVALKYLGRGGATPDVLDRLSANLDDIDKASLVGARRKLPGWLSTAVAQVAAR